MAYYSFADDIVNERAITVYSMGDSSRDFTYITDVVDGIVSSLSMATASPEVFNLGNNEPVKLLDFIASISAQVGKQANMSYLGDAKGEVPITYANIQKARCLLGYDPSTSIHDGLREFVRWFMLEDGSRYANAPKP